MSESVEPFVTAPPNPGVLQTNGIFCACDGLSHNFTLGPANTTIDTTANNTIEITVTPSAANNNLGMLLDECLIEYLKT